MLRVILRLVDGLCWIGAAIGGLACAALAVMLIVEVITTSFFAYSQFYAVEYSAYFLAMVLFGGAGWTLRQGGHIRVALLFGVLPPAMVRLLDGLCTAFALGISIFISQAMIGQTLRTVELGSRSYYPSETPLAFPQAFLTGGFVLLALALLARLLRLLAGEPPEATEPSDQISGTKA